MTTTSYGYTGSLNAGTWAQGEGFTGARVKGSGDLQVTAVGGSRAVNIAAGEAFSSGVRTVVTGSETVSLSTPAAGQFFLIVAHRNWGTNATSFVALDGPTTTTSVPTSAPTAPPSGYASTPGTSEDQALAWAWVNFSSTTVTIFDVRAVLSDGIPVVPSTAGLYLLRGQVGQLAATSDGNVYKRTGTTTWATFPATSSSGPTAQQAMDAATAAQATANTALSDATAAQSAANAAQSTANADAAAASGTGSVVSGWQLNRFALRKVNHTVHIDLSVTRTGGAITSGGTGNINNFLIGHVGSWVPGYAWAGLAPGPGGPVTSCAVDGSGALYLCAVAPNYTVGTGDEVTAGGSWYTTS